MKRYTLKQIDNLTLKTTQARCMVFLLDVLNSKSLFAENTEKRHGVTQAECTDTIMDFLCEALRDIDNNLSEYSPSVCGDC